MSYRLVVVGECPGRESIADRPSLALTGSSGRNLASIAGWDWLDYLRHTERMNLFLDPQPVWDARAAAASASRIVPLLERRKTVLCGAKVARAFELEGYPFYEWLELDPEKPGLGSVALIPHPSGRNRLWNAPAERKWARAFLHELIP